VFEHTFAEKQVEGSSNFQVGL